MLAEEDTTPSTRFALTCLEIALAAASVLPSKFVQPSRAFVESGMLDELSALSRLARVHWVLAKGGHFLSSSVWSSTH